MSQLNNAHALLIGIDYEDGLDTRGDAKDLAAMLTDPTRCGYPEENVSLLLGEEADRKGILNAFDKLIERTDDQSAVFLYYSGHGDVLDDVFHFVPYGIVEGMEYDDYTAAWVTAAEVREKINALATRRLIFFMDCCHATGMAVGGFDPRISGENSSDSEGEPAFDKMEGLAQKVDNEKGISIIASCKEDQLSYQLNADKNSLFTKYLLKALNGEHLSEFHDPYVRILEVAGYLLRKVPERLQQEALACDPPLDIAQEPYVNLEMYDNFILSYIPEDKRKGMEVGDLPPAPADTAQSKKPPRLIFRESDDANNLILFLHGFTGEAGDTFGTLPDLLMKDPELEGWDMKPFGYSQFIQPEHGKHVWGGSTDIQRISDYLRTSMKYKFDKYDRIALIGHGLGGLIAQRALLDLPEAQSKKISHLILMACPSGGIPEESIDSTWKEDFADIGAQSEFIQSLRSQWSEKFGAEPPFRLTVAAAAADPFVTVEAALNPFENDVCNLLSANHFSIVKPADTEDEGYRLVRESLTRSEFFAQFGDPRERNLTLGNYEAVVKDLLPRANELDPHGLRQLIFGLEGLDRRDEALKILDSHPAAAESSDLMGIIGGRFKRDYLKKPNKQDGESAQVYYSLALEIAMDQDNKEQVYYHAINLAFLSLVIAENRNQMRAYAQQAKTAAEQSPDSLWKTATVAEADLYLGNTEAAREGYQQAAHGAGIREKISIHLNAASAGARLLSGTAAKDFDQFLKSTFLT
ncbi:PGAP1-like protein [Robiginitalea myxolifaciens]|uniref:PGAP1-like protein n=1 Tax=Robiginitalea myxolifaciens TaxID=400055 RepID=A0A1I6FW41_9FLAO|nr:caspase family protein [Robiginitalea myxolifaciens]SFR34140.1 PGAP1-like protein [Robiginitalea myxolifaciens]